MTREWKPGDVVLMACGEGIAFRTSKGWRFEDGNKGVKGFDYACRPLVVLDPENREHVREFAAKYDRAVLGDVTPEQRTTAMQAALRSLNEPPRIPQPGLWGVVEARVDGIPTRRWVHHEEDRWVADTGQRRFWEDLIDPTLVREGVEDR